MIDNQLFSLYLVATPIGNLSDISFRAIEVFNMVDFIACEDTRKTGLLLKHYNIHKSLFPYFEHNEEKATERIINLILEGKKVALVTNAGTPGISDPGYKLIQRAIEESIPFTVIPGPSAFVMAVVQSGLPTHSFIYRGFPPRKPGARKRFLQADESSLYTLVYYESSHRLLKFLEDALNVFGDRQCAIANDLTKFYEIIKRGSLTQLLNEFKSLEVLGEYVIVIEGIRSPEQKTTFPGV